MARFYFQPNHKDPTFEDHQGIEPPDLDDARQAATRAARVFIHAEAEKGEPCTCCCVEVSSAAELHAKAALSARVVDGPNSWSSDAEGRAEPGRPRGIARP